MVDRRAFALGAADLLANVEHLRLVAFRLRDSTVPSIVSSFNAARVASTAAASADHCRRPDRISRGDRRASVAPLPFHGQDAIEYGFGADHGTPAGFSAAP